MHFNQTILVQNSEKKKRIALSKVRSHTKTLDFKNDREIKKNNTSYLDRLEQLYLQNGIEKNGFDFVASSKQFK